MQQKSNPCQQRINDCSTPSLCCCEYPYPCWSTRKVFPLRRVFIRLYSVFKLSYLIENKIILQIHFISFPMHGKFIHWLKITRFSFTIHCSPIGIICPGVPMAKITAVKCIRTRVNGTWGIVKILTDQPGLYGIGSASDHYHQDWVWRPGGIRRA